MSRRYRETAMDDQRVAQDIIEINRRLCFDIWSLSTSSGDPSGLSPRLLLPVGRNQAPRFSEQEARFLYCALLNSLGYFYSVETPTQGVYKQKGRTASTAASDLSLYRHDGGRFRKLVNVEFKHSTGYDLIRKDIEKLMGEGILGNWFHFLKNIDKSTLPNLCGKLSRSLAQCYHPEHHHKVSIVLAFCVFERRWACIKHFEFTGTGDTFRASVGNLMCPEYQIAKGKIEVSNKRGWAIIEDA
jgi:hypothetical protein